MHVVEDDDDGPARGEVLEECACGGEGGVGARQLTELGRAVVESGGTLG